MSTGLLASGIPLLICFSHRKQAALFTLCKLVSNLVRLPARLSRLARVTAIVVASSTGVTPTASAKTLAGAWPICLRLCFINFKRSTAELGSIQCRNGLLSFPGIRHLDECKTARTSSFPIGDHADLIYLSVCLEETAQLGFAGAMWQISYVKVLHCTFSMIT